MRRLRFIMSRTEGQIPFYKKKAFKDSRSIRLRIEMHFDRTDFAFCGDAHVWSVDPDSRRYDIVHIPFFQISA